MTESLDFSLSISTPVAPSGDGVRLVYTLVEIRSEEDGESSASNLVFLIDTSNSMLIRQVTETQFAEMVKNGHAQEIMTDGIPAYQISSIPAEMWTQLPRRIDFVSDALRIASEALRENDFFSLAAFASQARCLIEQTSGVDRERLRQMAYQLDTLNLGDETRMDEGMAVAIEQALLQPGKELPTRLILLTDGHTQNVRQCYEWARKAHEVGIKLTTMGIGSEFNEELLIPLADISGGNAYYLETPEKVLDSFRVELGLALKIRYRNLEVKLQLEDGVSLRRVYRVLPEMGDFENGPERNGSYSLLIGDDDLKTPLAFLLEMIIPDAPPGSQNLGQAMLAWDDPKGGIARRKLNKALRIERAAQHEVSSDERVMRIVERVGMFRMGTQALEMARKAAGEDDPAEKGAATIKLRQAATQLLNMGEVMLADAMFHQADVMEASGRLEPDAAKKLRYETRRLGQR